MRKFADLFELIKQDGEARQYYDKLPDYVRDQIASRAHNVNSFQSLRDYAENLTRGDG